MYIWLNVHTRTHTCCVHGHMHAWNHICFLHLGWKPLTFSFHLGSLVFSKSLSWIRGVCWEPWANEYKGLCSQVKYLAWFTDGVADGTSQASNPEVTLNSPFLFLYYSTQFFSNSSLPVPSLAAIAAISFLTLLSTGTLPCHPCLLGLLECFS